MAGLLPSLLRSQRSARKCLPAPGRWDRVGGRQRNRDGGVAHRTGRTPLVGASPSHCLGLNLITLAWTNSDRVHPTDYRPLAEAKDGKAKNDHFPEMLTEIVRRGLRPRYVLFDGSYASIEEFKAVRLMHAERTWSVDEYHRGLKSRTGVDRPRVARRGRNDHIGIGLMLFVLMHMDATDSWWRAVGSGPRG